MKKNKMKKLCHNCKHINFEENGEESCVLADKPIASDEYQYNHYIPVCVHDINFLNDCFEPQETCSCGPDKTPHYCSVHGFMGGFRGKD